MKPCSWRSELPSYPVRRVDVFASQNETVDRERPLNTKLKACERLDLYVVTYNSVECTDDDYVTDDLGQNSYNN